MILLIIWKPYPRKIIIHAIYSSLKYYLSLNSLNIPKKLSFDDVILNAKIYLKLRDFDKNKIIEYHIEEIL